MRPLEEADVRAEGAGDRVPGAAHGSRGRERRSPRASASAENHPGGAAAGAAGPVEHHEQRGRIAAGRHGEHPVALPAQAKLLGSVRSSAARKCREGSAAGITSRSGGPTRAGDAASGATIAPPAIRSRSRRVSRRELIALRGRPGSPAGHAAYCAGAANGRMLGDTMAPGIVRRLTTTRRQLMASRKRYQLDRVTVEPGDSRPATWTFAGEAVSGTEQTYAVTDGNFPTRNTWEFMVRIPKARGERLEVRPRTTPNLKVWAELTDRSLTFARATKGEARGRWYCQVALADPTGATDEGRGEGRRAAPAPRVVRPPAGPDAAQAERPADPGDRRRVPRRAGAPRGPRRHDPALLRDQGLGAEGTDLARLTTRSHQDAVARIATRLSFHLPSSIHLAQSRGPFANLKRIPERTRCGGGRLCSRAAWLAAPPRGRRADAMPSPWLRADPQRCLIPRDLSEGMEDDGAALRGGVRPGKRLYRGAGGGFDALGPGDRETVGPGTRVLASRSGTLDPRPRRCSAAGASASSCSAFAARCSLCAYRAVTMTQVFTKIQLPPGGIRDVRCTNGWPDAASVRGVHARPA